MNYPIIIENLEQIIKIEQDNFWDYESNKIIISKSLKIQNWAEPYEKYDKISEIPIKNRLIETQHTNELKWLFTRLNISFNINFNIAKKMFFNAVIGQYTQDFLQENGDPETPEPLLLATIKGAKDWYDYIIETESLATILYEDYSNKSRKVKNLRRKINHGQFSKSYSRFGGADVIVTDTHSEWADEQIPVIGFQEITPRRREVLTKHYLEVSWLFMSLKTIFNSTYDHISKYDFFAIIAQSAINYLEENGDPETPEPLLLAVLSGADKWIRKLEQNIPRE